MVNGKQVVAGVSGGVEVNVQNLVGDKMKVDEHLSSLSDIRSRLGVIDVTPGTGGCVKPARPTLTSSAEVMINGSGMEVENPANDVDTPQRNQLAQSLLVSALT